MEKRAIIAVSLCFIFYFAYAKLMNYLYPDYGQSQQEIEATSENNEPVLAGHRDTLPENFPIENAQSEEKERLSLSTGSQESLGEERIPLDFGPYSLGFSDKGGSIVSVNFADYEDPDGSSALSFIDTPYGERGVGAIDFWVDDRRLNTKSSSGKVSRNAFDHEFISDEFEIKKQFKFQENFANQFSFNFKNKTDKAVKLRFKLSSGSGIVLRNTIDTQYRETNWIGPKKIKHIKNVKEGKSKTAEEPHIATSIKSRHFSSILKPLGKTTYFSHTEGYADKKIGAWMLSPEIIVHPGESFGDEYLYYLGPNQAEPLEAVGLGQVITFGKLDSICKLLLGGMQLVYGVVKNYGLSIIILTLCLNVLLMPLTKASFMSMRRMQLVQPEVMKLREKYGKKDPAKLNKEMMDIYKKNKVNPLGGCFPMLLQMPIFISLYVALSKSTELLGAKFLWVKDLAYPDNIQLPFSLPFLGDSIHLLPLIMMVAMVLQQKISMANMPQADPNVAQQQKIMMIFMPIFFGFIFYPMPSGLVIYWLTNTVAMTFYQALLRRQAPMPVPKAK